MIRIATVALNKHFVKYCIGIFLFSIAMMQGISFTVMNNYTESMSPDALSYVEIAKGNFDQEPIHKYRVLVPFAAAGVDFLLGPVFEKIRPWSFEGDFSLFVSFWIVNTTLMALFVTAVFFLCRAYAVSVTGAIVGLMTIYTCRWTAYLAGLPLVDSLYCLVSTLVLLGIKKKNNMLIVFCILIGPWAKESFIFIAPLIFFFASMHKLKQLGWFLLSGALVFGFRFYLDHYMGIAPGVSLERSIAHLHNFYYSTMRLVSFHGLYEIFSVTGMWVFIPLYFALRKRTLFVEQLKNLDWFMLLYLGAVLIQALLSTDLARMFYLTLPVFAVYIGLASDNLISMLKKYSVEDSALH